jgi:replicative DNA helicase
MLNFEKDRRSRAEQLLLSALLRDNDCTRHIDSMCLTPREFSHDLHGQIFRHIAKLIALNQPADIVTVYESMQRHRSVPGVGVLAYLNALNQLPSVPANAGYYAMTMRGFLRGLQLPKDPM